MDGKTFVVIVCFFVLFILALLWVWAELQQKYIFSPVVGIVRPALEGIAQEQMGSLTLWIADRARSDKVIIFFHGAYGNLEHSARIIEMLTCFDCSVLAFDYSGYGASKGKPSTQQIIADGIAIYDYAEARWPFSELILWGHSLGTSAATYVASKRECRALVLMAPFYSLAELGRDCGGFLWLASAIFSRIANALPTNEWMRKVTCRVAILHSLNDKLISYHHAMMLYEDLLNGRSAAGQLPAEARKSLLLLPTDGNHSCTLLSPSQLRSLTNFLDISQRGDACLRSLEAAAVAPECIDS